MRSMRALTLVVAAGVVAAPAAAAAPSAPLADRLVPAFVGFHDDVPADAVTALLAAGAEHAVEIASIDSVATVAPLSVLQDLAQDPRVRGVRAQRRLDLHLYRSKELMNALGAGEPATYTATGADGATVTHERPAATGAGVTVGVIDSGVYAAHPDLLGRVTQGYNFEFSLLAREAGFTADQWDNYVLATGLSALQDEVGHGTHVAGTIAGTGAAASGLDLAGVAPGVDEIVSLKIASAANGVVEDVGFEANAVAAIDYVIRHNDDLGIRVINNSWGLLEEEAQGALGATDYDPAREVTAAAVEAGIVMVFSAGNDHDTDADDVDTIRPVPNGMDEVLTVAAGCKGDDAEGGSCPIGEVTGFSSRGATQDVTAPGDQILAAQSPSALAALGQTLEGSYFGAPQDEPVNRAGYMRLSGTSMAAPHATGAVALLLSVNPDLTPAEVERILEETAQDLYAPGWDRESGYGMIDVERALQRAHLLTVAAPADAPPTDDAPAPAPAPAPASPAPDGSAPLPTTGGGFALAGILAVAAGVATRRR